MAYEELGWFSSPAHFRHHAVYAPTEGSQSRSGALKRASQRALHGRKVVPSLRDRLHACARIASPVTKLFGLPMPARQQAVRSNRLTVCTAIEFAAVALALASTAVCHGPSAHRPSRELRPTPIFIFSMLSAFYRCDSLSHRMSPAAPPLVASDRPEYSYGSQRIRAQRASRSVQRLRQALPSAVLPCPLPVRVVVFTTLVTPRDACSPRPLCATRRMARYRAEPSSSLGAEVAW